MLFSGVARSGGTGRRAGLKIQWYLVPCGFDPLLRDQFSYHYIGLHRPSRSAGSGWRLGPPLTQALCHFFLRGFCAFACFLASGKDMAAGVIGGGIGDIFVFVAFFFEFDASLVVRTLWGGIQILIQSTAQMDARVSATLTRSEVSRMED